MAATHLGQIRPLDLLTAADQPAPFRTPFGRQDGQSRGENEGGRISDRLMSS